MLQEQTLNGSTCDIEPFPIDEIPRQRNEITNVGSCMG